MDELPEGWRAATFEELLSDELRKELKEFLKKKKGTDPLSLTPELSVMFKKHEDELRQRGVLPEYLAYAVSFLIQKYGYDKVILELKAKKKLEEVL